MARGYNHSARRGRWVMRLVRVAVQRGAHLLSAMSLVGATRTAFRTRATSSSKKRVVRRALSNCRTRWKSPSRNAVERAMPAPAGVLTRDNPHLSRPKNTPPDCPDSPSDEARSATSEHRTTAIDGLFVQLSARERRPILSPTRSPRWSRPASRTTPAGPDRPAGGGEAAVAREPVPGPGRHGRGRERHARPGATPHRVRGRVQALGGCEAQLRRRRACPARADRHAQALEG
jgi:hypothetical protein